MNNNNEEIKNLETRLDLLQKTLVTLIEDNGELGNQLSKLLELCVLSAEKYADLKKRIEILENKK
jgi:hypothetical protein